MRDEDHPIRRLWLADSGLAKEVQTLIEAGSIRSNADHLTCLVDDAIWGLSQEYGFGRAVALGYARLMVEQKEDQIASYRKIVRECGRNGTTMGTLMASHLVPVLLCEDPRCLEYFLRAYKVMAQKGVYTLKKPFEGLSNLLASGETETALDFLNLLYHTFSLDLSYQQSLHLTYTLPKAINEFSPARRIWQMRELIRIVQVDISMVAGFLEGLKRGLNLLSEDALKCFVSISIETYERDPIAGRRFISLESRLALEKCSDLQVAIPLSQMAPRLARYVRARTGQRVKIKPVSDIHLPTGSDSHDADRVFSDATCIYLPDEIDVFQKKKENEDLYKHLVRLESGLQEFGSFDFDYERALARCGDERISETSTGDWKQESGSNIELFFQLFPLKKLAEALFIIYDHGRTRRLLTDDYPGIAKQVLPIFQKEMTRIYAHCRGEEVLIPLYGVIALDMPLKAFEKVDPEGRYFLQTTRDSFVCEIENDATVETCARLIWQTYDTAHGMLKRQTGRERAGGISVVLKTPFGRGLKPDFRFHMDQRYDRIAASLRRKLRRKGITVYQTDIRKRLQERNGRLSPDDIRDIIIALSPDESNPDQATDKKTVDLSWLDLPDDCEPIAVDGLTQHQTIGAQRIVTYPEWDCALGDYLKEHVRVIDRTAAGESGRFYQDTLDRHQGLIQGMRYAFELLRPEGLSLLRQWVEGDQFDYRALLDFFIDRKIGRIPSDRLYMKRIKKQRDVAVLLLMDLSRSTANLASGSHATVLDIEKEAIVLLAEALSVVGDQFAVAGFSGSGRYGVDYIRIKNFEDPIDDGVRNRINGIAPLRSTRMGAAIRHATSELVRIPTRTRILIVISDGFPNDIGYKKAYAIEDTRKAVFEARSKQISFKAIAVNIAGDPKLDDLYGKYHHTLIADINDLPDKLLGIYGAMTRT